MNKPSISILDSLEAKTVIINKHFLHKHCLLHTVATLEHSALYLECPSVDFHTDLYNCTTQCY